MSPDLRRLRRNLRAIARLAELSESAIGRLLEFAEPTNAAHATRAGQNKNEDREKVARERERFARLRLPLATPKWIGGGRLQVSAPDGLFTLPPESGQLLMVLFEARLDELGIPSWVSRDAILALLKSRFGRDLRRSALSQAMLRLRDEMEAGGLTRHGVDFHRTRGFRLLYRPSRM
jgi:hypothetical protein